MKFGHAAACFLPGRATDLSAPLIIVKKKEKRRSLEVAGFVFRVVSTWIPTAV
jgi:hypothetical protein